MDSGDWFSFSFFVFTVSFVIIDYLLHEEFREDSSCSRNRKNSLQNGRRKEIIQPSSITF